MMRLSWTGFSSACLTEVKPPEVSVRLVIKAGLREEFSDEDGSDVFSSSVY